MRTFFCSSDPFKIFLDKSGERFVSWGLPAGGRITVALEV